MHHNFIPKQMAYRGQMLAQPARSIPGIYPSLSSVPPSTAGIGAVIPPGNLVYILPVL